MSEREKYENLFAFHISTSDIVTETPEREYRFHPERKWRFDFAWPKRKIAVEVEGAVWARGRHTRGAGYTADCTKYNAAAELGWQVFRYTTGQVQDGEALLQIERVFAEEDK